jgi:hypothetical protein
MSIQIPSLQFLPVKAGSSHQAQMSEVKSFRVE